MVSSLEPCSGERCADFWQFGWDEGGLYDVTAGIDFALQQTGETQVSAVIATSQYIGTTVCR